MNPIIITVIAIVLTWLFTRLWYINIINRRDEVINNLISVCDNWTKHSIEQEREMRKIAEEMSRPIPDILGMGIVEPVENSDYREDEYEKWLWDNPNMGDEHYPQEPGEAKKWYEESSSAIGHREDHIPDDSGEDAENL